MTGVRGQNVEVRSSPRRILNEFALSHFHRFAQDGVDCGSIAAAMFAEERKHIGIEPQDNLPFWPAPDDGPSEEIRAGLGRIGEIYFRILERVNPFPVCPFPVCLGSPSRSFSRRVAFLDQIMRMLSELRSVKTTCAVRPRIMPSSVQCLSP